MEPIYKKTGQKPINSGFSRKTTAEQVAAGVNLNGVIALITGGYSGIGLETARILVNSGASVIIPVRNKRKADETLKGLSVRIEEMDLSDPSSIDDFAEKFLASGKPLHLLINNAGIMAPPLSRDKRGYELQFSTNHLGHFRLTARLFPALLATARGGGKPRVVTVSSRAHRRSAFNFVDPNYEKTQYDPWKAYGSSKTANCLFAVELDRRAAAYGVRSFAVHPGLIPSTSISSAKNKSRSRFYRNVINLCFAAMNILRIPLVYTALRRLLPNRRGNELKTVAQGAATTVFCAVSPQLNNAGGVYCEDCDIAEAVPIGSKAAFGVRPYAIDPAASERLWALSEELNGIKFDI